MTTLLTLPVLMIITQFFAHMVSAIHLIGHLVK